MGIEEQIPWDFDWSGKHPILELEEEGAYFYKQCGPWEAVKACKETYDLLSELGFCPYFLN